MAVVCAIAFLLLAILHPGAVFAAFDARVGSFVAGLPVPVAAWEPITTLGGGVLVAVDVAIVAVLLARRELAMAILVAVTLIAVNVGVDVIKDTVARARPAEPLVAAHGGSFPSGHAFLSIVTYGLLALVVWRGEAPRAVRLAMIVGAAVLVLLIGCSRVALGVHYPTDVVAGWLGGLGVLALVVAATTTLAGLTRPIAARGHP